MPRHLSIHGVVVPTLGLGTYKLRGSDAETAVRNALDIGYRHIDTAQMYGNEEEVGRGLKASGVARDDVFVTTKVWRDDLDAAGVHRVADESLRKLDTDYVDLLLMHWPNADIPLEETIRALADVRDAGKARLIGVSNTPIEMLERALEIEPTLACDQVEYHPFLSQDTLLEAVRARGLFLTAYSPIAQGAVVDDATLQAIGDAHGATPVQVTLAWLIQQDRVAAVPKATSRAHIEANFAALDLTLSADEVAQIDALARSQRLVQPGFAPDWDA